MAQLTDDCFAFSGPLLPIADMERMIAERVQPVTETESVPLAAARGRVLAGDVIAPIDLPPFDNSAVDGYAVRHRDLDAKAETRLAIGGRLTAGSAAARPIGAGEAIRIFTGAPMPAGADTVFMQEDVRAEGDAVIVPAGLKAGANRRLAGEDVRKGSVVLPAGPAARRAGRGARRRGRPDDTRGAAARARRAVLDRRRDRRAGQAAARRRALRRQPHLARRHARPPRRRGDRSRHPQGRSGGAGEAIASAARDHDLVLTSGGVSTGEADHVRSAVEKVGRLVFWRVAIKPGRPVAMGVIRGASAEDGAAFVGLPGNPVAAFVTFARVVRPLLLRLAGAMPEPLTALPVRLAFPYKKKTGRREYVRVALRAWRRRRSSRRSSIRRRARASSPRSPKPTGLPSSPKTRRRSSRARPSDFSRMRR